MKWDVRINYKDFVLWENDFVLNSLKDFINSMILSWQTSCRNGMAETWKNTEAIWLF